MKGLRFVIIYCIGVLCLAVVSFYNTISIYTQRSHVPISCDTYGVKADSGIVTPGNNASRPLRAAPTQAQTITTNERAPEPPTDRDTHNSKMFLTTIISGRLGNHLFIYATLLGVARALNRRPFLKNGIDLSGTFRISYVDPSIDTKGWAVIHTPLHTQFESRFMQLPEMNITLQGSFQSWKYFQHIQSEIRREFTLTTEVQNQVNAILAPHRNSLMNNALVGVHVRRGDFLDPGNVKLGFGVPNRTYFANAFAKMRSLLAKKNVTFLVASDDVQWCSENLNDAGVTVLAPNSPGLDLSVLASCDHMIISGGTFGWWAAWLANGITIYYSEYILPNTRLSKGYDKDDYYIPGWIGLNNTSV